MQNFMLIAVTVTEIAVTGQRKNCNQYSVAYSRVAGSNEYKVMHSFL